LRHHSGQYEARCWAVGASDRAESTDGTSTVPGREKSPTGVQVETTQLVDHAGKRVNDEAGSRRYRMDMFGGMIRTKESEQVN
jgi:hypothetical protein